MRKKDSVRWDCEKEKRERELDLEKTKIEREREYGEIKKKKKWERERESQTLLLTSDVNTVCVKGRNWPFLTSYGCIWYFLKLQGSLL